MTQSPNIKEAERFAGAPGVVSPLKMPTEMSQLCPRSPAPCIKGVLRREESPRSDRNPEEKGLGVTDHGCERTNASRANSSGRRCGCLGSPDDVRGTVRGTS